MPTHKKKPRKTIGNVKINQAFFHFRDSCHPQYDYLLGVAWIFLNLRLPNVFMWKKEADWINDMDG